MCFFFVISSPLSAPLAILLALSGCGSVAHYALNQSSLVASDTTAMGRRAKKTKEVKKVRPKVDSVFKCPYCNHPDAVECRLEQKRGVGSLECRICGASRK
jgi:hypothetical protein